MSKKVRNNLYKCPKCGSYYITYFPRGKQSFIKCHNCNEKTVTGLKQPWEIKPTKKTTKKRSSKSNRRKK